MAGNQHVRLGNGQFIETGNEIHYYAGDKVVIEAGMELTLKGGGSWVRLDPGGVSISGATIKLNSGGSPGKGSGAAPLLPGPLQQADRDKEGGRLLRAPRSYRARYLLLDEKTGEPLLGQPYTLKRADGSLLAGYTDHEGKTFMTYSDEPAEIELLLPRRRPEQQEPLYLAGEPAAKDRNLDFKTANPEGD
ncbi:hypothetical protein FQZ97_692750 [compost metagenome]